MTTKCDLTIGKKFTINTGNYSSVQPNVSLTIKDIPISKLMEIKEAMITIVYASFIEEAKSCCDDMRMIRNHGIKKIMEELDEEQMEEDVKEAIVKLMNKDGEWEI